MKTWLYCKKGGSVANTVHQSTDEPIVLLDVLLQLANIAELGGVVVVVCVDRTRGFSEVLSASGDDIIRGRASNVQREL